LTFQASASWASVFGLAKGQNRLFRDGHIAVDIRSFAGHTAGEARTRRGSQVATTDARSSENCMTKCAGFCSCVRDPAEKYIVGRFVKDFNAGLMKS
jgi:hypothetical protein